MVCMGTPVLTPVLTPAHPPAPKWPAAPCTPAGGDLLGTHRATSKGVQQDGASCHTAKSTKQWLERHKIPLFPHPASSPDITPIEPIWHELKKRVRAHNPRPTSFETLKQAILEEWEAMPMEDINKYALHMRERVEAILEANGGHTRY
ncbi:unnamed protein product [Mycena citricolor]|uniref:Tc1-like transposase DDE domain-containing protein n=1 Tax=Mycena citricolor TaxID=2018698 RepID=A0AAD2H272_9AGAR|nr:unnamed protein product [Mycena citricolor]